MNLKLFVLKQGIKRKLPEDATGLNSILFLFDVEKENVRAVVEYTTHPENSPYPKIMKAESDEAAIIPKSTLEEYTGLIYQMLSEEDKLEKGSLLIDFEEGRAELTAFYVDPTGQRKQRKQPLKI